MNTLIIVIIVLLAVLSTPLSLKALIDREKARKAETEKEDAEAAGELKEAAAGEEPVEPKEEGQ